MHGQQVAHGNPLQHCVPARRLALATAIHKGIVGPARDGGRAKDRSHFALFAWLGQGRQHFQRAPSADSLLQ